ncbi:HAD family hydrolase [uncultured Methanomethylovorans sp.]|uniref:HAD family hydrolase n=1 Tax=uncultured Methanomethylovorans sp. TaxID=183759 RepID=UPI002AA6ADBE|nr:HAD family hydrolase [uncultured Methanomethylovorans sp.]
MFESSEIKGMIFDLYGTLIDIRTDEHDFYTYDTVSKWLQYKGVKIDPEVLKSEYYSKIAERMAVSKEQYPEVRVEEIFADICSENAIWKSDTNYLGIETSKVFRSASLRRMRPFEESMKILKRYNAIPKCLVSNGQRVFSEKELRFLGMYKYFDHVIFSSDVRYKKPDHRIFKIALDRLNLKPGEVLSIGDTVENDIVAPREMGMEAMHIYDAWLSLLK